MNATAFLVVDRLGEVWSAWSREPEFPLRPDHCINGSRIAKEVLTHYDVESDPVSVSMCIFNRFAWDLHTRDVPMDEWPEHAHSIGVGPGMVSKPGRWNGHLWLEGPDWSLDISAGQFARPGKIVVEGPMFLPERLPPGRELLALVDRYGQRILANRNPGNNGWRAASGWQLTANNREVVAEVLRRMEA